MSKVKKPQGKTTNKLVITFKDYSTQPYETTRESFRCNSLDAANKILSTRDKRRIFFANHFDENGGKATIQFNTKKTILSV